MEHEGSLPYLQELATSSYPKPDQSSRKCMSFILLSADYNTSKYITKQKTEIKYLQL
jgi:hypothetical protein